MPSTGSRPAQAGDLPLSIVVTARNDDHGGNLLQRMQIFINGLLEQARRHHLQAELLLVEWNPPPDKAPLAEALDWSVAACPCRVRIIQASPTLHRRYRYAEALPMFQMIAKNVGIRRARGRFILATNIDLLFSDALIQFLAGENLNSGYLYRIDRHDVPADVPLCSSIDEQLAYCRQHIIRVNARQGVFVGEQPPRGKAALLLALLGHYLWLAKANQAAGPKQAAARPRPDLAHFWRYQRSLIRRGLIRFKDLLQPSFPRLHMTASGDFTLMGRENWWALRSYPELEMFSMHLDSLLCYMAHYAGIKERVLEDPMRIYHIEHSSGWTPEIDRDQLLDRRLDFLGVPQVSRQQLRSWVLEMARRQQPLIFNDEDWGLAGEDLPEIEING